MEIVAKSLRRDLRLTPGILEYRGFEECYTTTEKEILATYEGVRAASKVVGTETQLLLAP